MKATNGRSESANRFLTYCKAVGVLVVAASGISGMVISIITSYREPTENLAKQTYKEIGTALKKVSRDLQKEHDTNEHQHQLIGKDISAIRGEMKLVVRLLESARSRQPRRRTESVLRDLQSKVQKAPAVKSAGKKSRPPVRTLPPISNVQQQARTAFKKGDS